MTTRAGVLGRKPHWTVPTLLLLGLALIGVQARADIEGLVIHGFASVYYTDTTQQNAPTGRSGFKLDNLDLYIAPSLTDRIRALMEDVVEFDDWTRPGENNGQPVIDIERLQVGYLVSDNLTVWMGRFHSPYGYWNTAYHHGAQLQPTVARPQFLGFEDHGGILPAHTNGLWATGHYAIGPGRVTYDGYLGNGSRILDGALDMQNVGNANSHTALGTRLGYEFLGGTLDSLWVGMHAFSEQIDNFVGGVRTAQTDVKVVGAFGHWTPGDWELMSEYYRFDNKAHGAPGQSHTSSAWYVEADYTFIGRITPLARFEQDTLDQHDGYFENLLGGKSYRRSVVGLRYDLTPQTAIKIDANHTDMKRDGGQSFNEAHVQLAIRF